MSASASSAIRTSRSACSRHLGQRVGDLGEQQQLRHGLDVVDDVVELLGEGVDVLAVERRDEGGVQPLEDRPGDLVALVLALVDRLVAARGCRRR